MDLYLKLNPNFMKNLLTLWLLCALMATGTGCHSGHTHDTEEGNQHADEAVAPATETADHDHATETPDHADATEPTGGDDANTVFFSMEQAGKIDFATELPVIEPFGPVIQVVAQVQAAPGIERVVTAGTAGVVVLSNPPLLEGSTVTKGAPLLYISGSESAGNNLAVQYAEAENNFRSAEAEYERARLLAAEKIVSEKELEAAKTRFLNAEAQVKGYRSHFDRNGQQLLSPANGYLKALYVNNGSYVEAGTPVALLSNNRILSLYAAVPQKYGRMLGSVTSATVHTRHNNQTFTLEQLNGKILSYGKAVIPGSALVRLIIQIENNGSFTEGAFVELSLKSLTNREAITLPTSALLEEQGTCFVFVQLSPEQYEKRQVTPGDSDGIRSEIVRGILPTERVVTSGAIYLKLAKATGTLDPHSGHVH